MCIRDSRSTVYESATGGGPPRFRFQSCPMSRARIDAKAYPLVYLKSQIIEYKLKRLDGILGAVKAHVAPWKKVGSPMQRIFGVEA